MFIYTEDSIINTNTMLGLSINFLRGEKLTCPAIFVNQINGKSMAFIQCNTVHQCNEILQQIKAFILNGDTSYIVPTFELHTVRIRVDVSGTLHEYFVPVEEPTVLLQRFKIKAVGQGGVVEFDGSPLGMIDTAEKAVEILSNFTQFLLGDLSSNDEPFKICSY